MPDDIDRESPTGVTPLVLHLLDFKSAEDDLETTTKKFTLSIYMDDVIVRSHVTIYRFPVV